MAEVFSGEDNLHIIYEGPPRVVNGQKVNGKKFFLAGDRAKQAAEGIELARGVSGILRAPREHRYDTTANQPGSTYVDTVANRRMFNTAINVFGDTKAEFRNNWREWVRANTDSIEGKLWFLTSDAEPRYGYVRPSPEAGQSALEIDPNLVRKIEGLEWGWESDYPYLLGEKRQHFYDANGTVTFYNPSDVDGVTPMLYLPGPGVYKVGDITTPNLKAGEVIRINFSADRPTYVKMDTATKIVTNLWYTLVGVRPKLELKALDTNTHKITLPTTGVKSGAYLEYVPLFEGAF